MRSCDGIVMEVQILGDAAEWSFVSGHGFSRAVQIVEDVGL
jgi:hypothetical protein